jgi:hypothetical protein
VDMPGGKESLTLVPRDWDAKGLVPLVPGAAIADAVALRAPVVPTPAVPSPGLIQLSES